MISPNQIIGSLVYRTCEALNKNQKFLKGLVEYPYYENCLVDGRFNFWHYPGTPAEVSAVLIEIGEHPNGSLIKFPALLNYQSIRQKHWVQNGESRLSFNYNLSIATSVFSEWTTEQREREVFDPLLRPIYDEFIRQVQEVEYLTIDYGIPSHDVWEVFTTGDNEGVIARRYGEHVDALEIHNLSLGIKTDLCRWEDVIRDENAKATQKMINLLKTKKCCTDKL